MAKKFQFSIALLTGIASFSVNALGGNIGMPEAVEFTRARVLTLYPKITFSEKQVRIAPSGDRICYADSECWPVQQADGKIADLAYEIAMTLVPVRLEFDDHRDWSRQRPSWENSAYALEIRDASQLADALRNIEGYAKWNPYHIEIAPRELVNAEDKAWGKGFYHFDGAWMEARDLAIRYRPPAMLEEIYDGSPGLVFKLGVGAIRKNPFFNGQYVILSPWAVFPSSVAKDGKVLSSRLGVKVLPSR